VHSPRLSLAGSRQVNQQASPQDNQVHSRVHSPPVSQQKVPLDSLRPSLPVYLQDSLQHRLLRLHTRPPPPLPRRCLRE
jgi:hypothetical protein